MTPATAPKPIVTRVMTALKRGRTNALGVLFPPLCLHCDTPHDGSHAWLCPSCLDTLHTNARERPHCPRCAINQEHRECACTLAWDHPFERIHSLVDYHDIVRTIMHHIKYRGMSALAFDLGRRLGTTVPGPFWEGIDWVVPVPLHTIRRLRRGYNQATHLARGILAAEGVPPLTCHTHALRRTRHTRTQTKLDREQRQENLRGAFHVAPRYSEILQGKGVAVVDDVVTTGATTGTCAEALLAAGAARVRVLSLARD